MFVHGPRAKNLILVAEMRDLVGWKTALVGAGLCRGSAALFAVKLRFTVSVPVGFAAVPPFLQRGSGIAAETLSHCSEKHSFSANRAAQPLPDRGTSSPAPFLTVAFPRGNSAFRVPNSAFDKLSSTYSLRGASQI